MLPGIHAIHLDFTHKHFLLVILSGIHTDSMDSITENLFLDSTWNEPGMRMDSTRIPCILERKFPFWDILPGIHVESTWTPWSLPGFHKEAWGRVKYCYSLITIVAATQY
jgi:hypothetical protein